MAFLVLLNSGKPSEAIDLLTDAIKTNPDEPRTPYLNILAIAQFVTGDYLGATKSMEKLHRTHPDYPVEAWLKNYIKSDDELQSMLDKLHALNP